MQIDPTCFCWCRRMGIKTIAKEIFLQKAAQVQDNPSKQTFADLLMLQIQVH